MNNDRHLTMKDLPKSERPYEKCELYGVSALSDAELLAIMIRSGLKDMKAVDIAVSLLSADKRYPGLEGLMRLERHDFMKVPGIGKVKAIQLEALGELARRFTRISFKEGHIFRSAQDVADYYMAFMQYLEREELHLLMLDNRNRMIADKQLSIGTVNCAYVDTREIFIQALKHHAVNIILVHNHPGGDASASEEDIAVTNRVRQAGELIGIQLLDHIIIGHQNYTNLCS